MSPIRGVGGRLLRSGLSSFSIGGAGPETFFMMSSLNAVCPKSTRSGSDAAKTPAKPARKPKKSTSPSKFLGLDLSNFPATRSICERRNMAKSISIVEPGRPLDGDESTISEGMPLSAIQEFNQMCRQGGIATSAFKQRSRYQKKCYARREKMYARRKEIYNKLVGEKVQEIVRTYGHEVNL